MSNTFQINRKVRDAVILNLRRLFTADSKYPYSELPSGEFDFDRGKLYISDVIPQDSAFYPALIVDTVAGAETRYLGPDDLYETKDSNNHVITDQLFSSINLTVRIAIYTIDDTIARDEIIDRIYDHFKTITDDLADSGIEIKKTSFNSDQRVFEGDRWYIINSINMEVYTEWSDDEGPGEVIAKIPIDMQIETEQ